MIGSVLLTLLIGTFVSLYLFLTRNFDYWKRKGINYVPPTVGFGNFGAVFKQKKSIWQVIQEIHCEGNEKFTGVYIIDKPGLVVRDLDLIKSILITDFNHFIDRDFSPHEKNEPMMARSLFGMKGAQWKSLRAKLTPTFSSGKMKNMFYLIKACCDNLEPVLKSYADKDEPFPTKFVISRYTLDVITTCAFGIEGHNLENPDWHFGKLMRRVTNPTFFTAMKSNCMIMAPKLLYLFGGSVLPQEIRDALEEIIWPLIAHREKYGITRNDYLDILLELKKQTNSSSITMDNDTLLAQAFLFLIAGFETSSTVTTLTLFELSRHLDIQDKMRMEITNALSHTNGEITYESLSKMTYLDQVINEVLRKYPTLPFLDRLCVKDYKIPGTDIIIEKGVRIFISMMAIQYDSQYFENPQEFDPDRFSEERANSHHKFSFLPFGEGPRNCIGKRFGLMQTKAGLVQVLKNYKVVSCEQTPDKPTWNAKNFSLVAEGNLPISLKTA